jgi:hypothetical protein
LYLEGKRQAFKVGTVINLSSSLADLTNLDSLERHLGCAVVVFLLANIADFLWDWWTHPRSFSTFISSSSVEPIAIAASTASAD